MSDESNVQSNVQPNVQGDEDGGADAFAATAVIGIVVFTLYLWLSGMPS